MNRMSLLSQIQRQKTRLKETETIVMTANGQRYVEKLGHEVQFSRRDCPSSSFGFIVDTHPDDVPALLIEHLYIGAQDCVAPEILEKHNICYVLSLGIYVEVPNVRHKYVECLDLPETNLEPVLQECVPFIHEAISSNNNILVHCNAGVSRAAAIAIGYLVKQNKMSFDAAYSLAKNKRPAIQPNIGFQKQLKSLSQNINSVNKNS